MNRSTAKWIMNTIQCRKCRRRVDAAEVGNDFLCQECHVHSAIFPSGEVNRRRRGHIFLTPDMIRTIPALYATENVSLEDKVLNAHYFVGGCDWYVAELDPETGDTFAHCDLGMGFPEWGYVNLRELEETIAHGIYVVDRDIDFTPKTAKELGLS
jgi:Protein of unknown function (DUF2958)